MSGMLRSAFLAFMVMLGILGFCLSFQCFRLRQETLNAKLKTPSHKTHILSTLRGGSLGLGFRV